MKLRNDIFYVLTHPNALTSIPDIKLASRPKYVTISLQHAGKSTINGLVQSVLESFQWYGVEVVVSPDNPISSADNRAMFC